MSGDDASVLPTELWRASASALARAIRSKQVSASEVVEAHLSRISAVDGMINAVPRVLADEARSAALAAGHEIGPLHGVPITIKENIDLAGSATTHGLAALLGQVLPESSPFVAQLVAAGAIPIGRTNMPDLGVRWHADNALHGATKNPWDAARTPGGSSEGDAAALATGMTPLGFGNDYGGSLRIPSQFCGTCALRPTLGRVPQASALTPVEPLMTQQLCSVQGPMARHIADLRLALHAMSGPSARDPWWTPAPRAGEPNGRPKVAVCFEPGGAGIHPDVSSGIERAARALEQAGFIVEPAEPPAVERAASLWLDLVFTELRMGLAPLMKKLGSPGSLRSFELVLEESTALDLEGYMRGFGERHGLARAWSLFQEERPLILGPVSTEPAFEVGADLTGPDETAALIHSMRLTVAVNLLGLPAVAFPVGEANGLPQGVQLIGPRYREDWCLDAAEAVERALGRLTPIEPSAP